MEAGRSCNDAAPRRQGWRRIRKVSPCGKPALPRRGNAVDWPASLSFPPKQTTQPSTPITKTYTPPPPSPLPLPPTTPLHLPAIAGRAELPRTCHGAPVKSLAPETNGHPDTAPPLGRGSDMNTIGGTSCLPRSPPPSLAPHPPFTYAELKTTPRKSSPHRVAPCAIRRTCNCCRPKAARCRTATRSGPAACATAT